MIQDAEALEVVSRNAANSRLGKQLWRLFLSWPVDEKRVSPVEHSARTVGQYLTNHKPKTNSPSSTSLARNVSGPFDLKDFTRNAPGTLIQPETHQFYSIIDRWRLLCEVRPSAIGVVYAANPPTNDIDPGNSVLFHIRWLHKNCYIVFSDIASSLRAIHLCLVMNNGVKAQQSLLVVKWFHVQVLFERSPRRWKKRDKQRSNYYDCDNDSSNCKARTFSRRCSLHLWSILNGIDKYLSLLALIDAHHKRQASQTHRRLLNWSSIIEASYSWLKLSHK